MQVISVLNQKGGVGKTTLATNIARTLQVDGIEAVLVDSDPQGSARDWAAAREHGGGVQTLGVDRPRTLANDVRRLKADVVVIDGAPSNTELAAAAISAADFVLIPVQPSPYDIWAADGTVQLLRQRRALAGGDPAAAFVLSRVIPNTILGDDVRQVLSDIEDVPLLETTVHQRQAYPRLAAQGLAVADTRASRNEATEIRALIAEIQAAIHAGTASA